MAHPGNVAKVLSNQLPPFHLIQHKNLQTGKLTVVLRFPHYVTAPLSWSSGPPKKRAVMDQKVELPKILCVFLNDGGKLKRVTYVLKLSDQRTLAQIILDLRQLFGVGPRNEESPEERERFRWSLFDLNKKMIKKKSDLYYQTASTFQLQKCQLEERRETLRIPAVRQSRTNSPTNKDQKEAARKNHRKVHGWMLGTSTLRYQPVKKLRNTNAEVDEQSKQSEDQIIPSDTGASSENEPNPDSAADQVAVQEPDQKTDADSGQTIEKASESPKLEVPQANEDRSVIPAAPNPAVSSVDRRNEMPVSSWYISVKTDPTAKIDARIDIAKKVIEAGSESAQNDKKLRTTKKHPKIDSQGNTRVITQKPSGSGKDGKSANGSSNMANAAPENAKNDHVDTASAKENGVSESSSGSETVSKSMEKPSMKKAAIYQGQHSPKEIRAGTKVPKRIQKSILVKAQ